MNIFPHDVNQTIVHIAEELDRRGVVNVCGNRKIAFALVANAMLAINEWRPGEIERHARFGRIQRGRIVNGDFHCDPQGNDAYIETNYVTWVWRNAWIVDDATPSSRDAVCHKRPKSA